MTNGHKAFHSTTVKTFASFTPISSQHYRISLIYQKKTFSLSKIVSNYLYYISTLYAFVITKDFHSFRDGSNMHVYICIYM